MQVVFIKINKIFFGPIFLDRPGSAAAPPHSGGAPDPMHMGDRPRRPDMSQKRDVLAHPYAQDGRRRRLTQVPYGAAATL
jgi:hypothetical protein